MKTLFERRGSGILWFCCVLSLLFALLGCDLNTFVKPGGPGGSTVPRGATPPTPTPPQPPPPPGGGRPAVGVVLASGANVFLNKVTPVPNGATVRVYHGDEVTTGQGSSALVTFDAGGFIQLDEGTDPVFEYLQGQVVLLIRIFYGIAHLDSQNNLNIQVRCDEANAFLRSVINIRAEKGRHTTFTVVSGSLRVVPLSARLQPALIRESGQQVTVSRVQIEQIRTLPTQELQAVTKWRDKFPAIKLRIERLPTQPLIPPTTRELAPRVR